MIERFCIKCGKKTDRLNEKGLCTKCRPPQRRKIQKLIKVERCPHCNFYKLSGGWQPTRNENDLVRKTLERFLEDDYEFTYNKKFNRLFVNIFNNKENFKTTIQIQNTPCKLCNRKHGGFYTTKIQLRGNNLEENFKELMDLLVKKSTRLRFVSQIKKQKHGYDIFLSNLTFAQTILKDFSFEKQVKKKFSKELKSERGGKRIYRYVLSVRVE